MPREARKKSASGIYHIMLRGIDKQRIFFDDKDYDKILQVISYCKEKSGIELYAYCLMPNHIHMLVKEGSEPIETTIKRLGSKYVYWFNLKYDRVGHLFQDRFKSETVEDDSYFLSVIRYIHNNPVKAEMVRKPENYKYSSYNSYFNTNDFIDTERALSMISDEEFIRFHFNENRDMCLEITENHSNGVTDEDAERLFIKITNGASKEDITELSDSEKQRIIISLKQSGMSINQIMRITGLTYYYIQKVKI